MQLLIGRQMQWNGLKTHPHLNFGESIARKLRDRYNEITKHEKAITNKMPRLKYGRPLILGAIYYN